MLIFDEVPTPVGVLCCLADDEEVLLAAGFAATPEELRTIAHPSCLSADTSITRERLAAAHAAVAAWQRGDVGALNRVPVRQRADGFLPQVWQALRRIPPGETVSYRGLAELAGRPAAVRAAAQGCARNNIPLFVPCHRVVTSAGGLGGFGPGLPMKRRLLEHETGRPWPDR